MTGGASDAVLVINAGSSSIKFALYPAAGRSREPLCHGQISGIGRAPAFVASDADGQGTRDALPGYDKTSSHEDLIAWLLDWIGQHGAGFRLVAAGHRVVHGGREFTAPVRIDGDVLARLGTLAPLAPLHQPHNLAAIEAMARRMPDLPQIACFDTSFHRSQPELAQLYAIPHGLSDEGIVRYGFHGLSYGYIASVLPDLLGKNAMGRVIVAHLGNGASLCAMKACKSVASSMGFTALDGLVMGTRCGSIDPGVILYLMQTRGLSADQVQHMLYNDSGLLGVSGVSNNMQILQASEDPRAARAIDLFCYRAAVETAGLVAALEGLDALVFTAGIGENSALVRQKICARLAWLGLDLDPVANDANAATISMAQSKIAVLVVPTDEESVIADAVRALGPF